MKWNEWRITFLFTFLVFIVLGVTALLMGVFFFVLDQYGMIRVFHGVPILFLLIASVIIGTIFLRFLSRHAFNVVQELSDAAKTVAKGDFSVRVREDIPAQEFSNMAKSFNFMAEELSHNELMKNDFIENVSHEFKTPLSAIEGYATLLQTPGLTASQRQEYTSKIIASTGKMSDLVGNILLLSRLDNQDDEPEKQSFQLDEQIRETILTFENDWTSRGINLDVDMDEAVFYGNKYLLAEVWQNLLSNALKFTPDNGTVQVRLSINEGTIIVTFADTGIGINKKDIAHIFDKFYQADPSRLTSGNGLGLALVKKIIDLHHGTIDVASEEGKGTRFTVSLPLYEAEKD